jgi:hypothetical protein
MPELSPIPAPIQAVRSQLPLLAYEAEEWAICT